MQNAPPVPHPNVTVYETGMNASLVIKWRQIAPWILSESFKSDSVIVDEGCGTGKFLVKLARRFPEARIVGRDFSPHFVQQSCKETAKLKNVVVMQADVTQPSFPKNTVAAKIFSSVWHELYSFSAYSDETLLRILAFTRKELAPKGRLIIRDGLKPDSESVALWLENIRRSRRPDASMLSTRERFFAFVRDFRAAREVSYQVYRGRRDEEWRVVLDSADAYEFLMKKDYVENWKAETQEVFGVWTMGEYRRNLKAAGYSVVRLKPLQNRWIVEQRLKPTAKLFRITAGGAFVSKAFFPTNILAVAQRPDSS